MVSPPGNTIARWHYHRITRQKDKKPVLPKATPVTLHDFDAYGGFSSVSMMFLNTA
jgi:hypothetical protein